MESNIVICPSTEHNRLVLHAEWLDDWKLVNDEDRYFNFEKQMTFSLINDLELCPFLVHEATRRMYRCPLSPPDTHEHSVECKGFKNEIMMLMERIPT